MAWSRTETLLRLLAGSGCLLLMAALAAPVTASAASVATAASVARPGAPGGGGIHFVVDSPADHPDARIDGVCAVRAEDGARCTLRAALQEANASPAVDTLTFTVPKVAPTAPLPTVRAPVVMDGKGAVELDGGSGGAGPEGLVLISGGSTVRGLALTHWRRVGIAVTGPAGGNTIEGCLVGVRADGVTAAGNGSGEDGWSAGITIDSSPGNVLGGTDAGAGNTISGNHGPGIRVFGAGAIGTVIAGNTIGMDRNGFTPVPNTGDGISLGRLRDVAGTGAGGTRIGTEHAASANLVSGNRGDGISLHFAVSTTVLNSTVGLTSDGRSAGNGGAGIAVYQAPSTTIGTPGRGNVVSGNARDGIVAAGGGSTALVVSGNTVGADRAGTLPRPNGAAGIALVLAEDDELAPPHARIGGNGDAAGNLVSGNTGHGMNLYATHGAVLRGNRVGLARASTALLPNGKDGIHLERTTATLVGGAAMGQGNVIGGNRAGVAILGPASHGNTVLGNRIGATDTGAAVGNVYDGVTIVDSRANTVGYGPLETPKRGCAGRCNVIANNGQHGVSVHGAVSVGNTIRGNSIRQNKTFGIELGSRPDGRLRVLPDDATDADAGPNDLLNFPVGVLAVQQADNPGLASPRHVPGRRAVTGSSYPPRAGLTVDVYGLVGADDSDPWAPGARAAYGEGRDWLGETTTAADGSFTLQLSPADAADYTRFSATVTDVATGSTSTFSAVCRPVAGEEPDADEDGICDFWESAGGGLDLDGDGALELDLHQRSASPRHKDLFLEVDAFTTSPAQPAALRQVVAAFATSPVANPDGFHGIRLHVHPGGPPDADTAEPVADESIVPTQPQTALSAAEFDTLKNGAAVDPCDGRFGTAAERARPATCAAVLAAKRLVYRYALFADSLAIGDNSGVAPHVPGPDLLVALGGWTRDAPDASGFSATLAAYGGWPTYCWTAATCLGEAQAATLMHELGHSVGLLHGGRSNENHKPNYLSVMNYLFQGRFPVRHRPLDFSRVVLPELDEASLDERAAVAAGVDPVELRGWPSTAFLAWRFFADEPCAPMTLPLFSAPDWNANGSAGEAASVSRLLHDRNGCGPLGVALLKGWQDWGALSFSPQLRGRSANFGTGELPAAVLQRWASVVDSDRDGHVDSADNCPTQANPRQLDADDDRIGNACLASITKRDLSLTVTARPRVAAPGTPVTFTVGLRNRSPLPAGPVSVDVPPVWTPVSSVASAGSYDEAQGRWVVPALRAYGSAQLEFTAVAPREGHSDLQTAEIATATQADPDSVPANGHPGEDDRAVAGVLPPLPPGARRYRLTVLSAGTVAPTGMSASGRAVGTGASPHGATRAVSWSRNGIFSDLGALSGGTSTADAVSRGGLVAGTSTDAAGVRHVVTYHAGGVRDLGPLLCDGCEVAQVSGVNDAGTVVGWEQKEARVRGFVVTADGSRTTVGAHRSIVGGHAWAYGVHDDGTVFGTASGCMDETGRRCGNLVTTWTDGDPRALGTLGGDYGAARAINPSGVIAGASRVPYPPGESLQPKHAFTWRATPAGGRFTDLGGLPPQNEGELLALNAAGVAVGSNDQSGSSQRAVVSADGRLADLNVLVRADREWTLTKAVGIADDGRILALGDRRGEAGVILLTPVGGRSQS